MVTIATFNEPAKAKHLKNRFQQAGVKADIHNEARLQKVTGAQPLANAKVMVDEDEFREGATNFCTNGNRPIPMSARPFVARNATRRGSSIRR